MSENATADTSAATKAVGNAGAAIGLARNGKPRRTQRSGCFLEDSDGVCSREFLPFPIEGFGCVRNRIPLRGKPFASALKLQFAVRAAPRGGRLGLGRGAGRELGSERTGWKLGVGRHWGNGNP